MPQKASQALGRPRRAAYLLGTPPPAPKLQPWSATTNWTRRDSNPRLPPLKLLLLLQPPYCSHGHHGSQTGCGLCILLVPRAQLTKSRARRQSHWPCSPFLSPRAAPAQAPLPSTPGTPVHRHGRPTDGSRPVSPPSSAAETTGGLPRPVFPSLANRTRT